MQRKLLAYQLISGEITQGDLAGRLRLSAKSGHPPIDKPGPIHLYFKSCQTPIFSRIALPF
jgi:hypothetical protein